jgi:hypothetical protein
MVECYFANELCGLVLFVVLGLVVWFCVLKLTWRRVQGDHECSDPGWRLTIALRWVEARDGP